MTKLSAVYKSLALVLGSCAIVPILLFAAVSETGRIVVMVKEAKLLGRKEFNVPSVIGEGHYTIVTSLEQMLNLNVPLVVSIEDKASMVSSDGENLITWYVAHIIDNPTGIDLPSVYFDSSQEVPLSFQNIDRNSI